MQGSPWGASPLLGSGQARARRTHLTGHLCLRPYAQMRGGGRERPRGFPRVTCRRTAGSEEGSRRLASPRALLGPQGGTRRPPGLASPAPAAWAVGSGGQRWAAAPPRAPGRWDGPGGGVSGGCASWLPSRGGGPGHVTARPGVRWRGGGAWAGSAGLGGAGRGARDPGAAAGDVAAAWRA